ncbi:MAG TPA: DUF4440 domain-containing protein [Dongiaceae bacterium]|nr:DUF4440 domain-containing protein [Dongiaceae bacterium]
MSAKGIWVLAALFLLAGYALAGADWSVAILPRGSGMGVPADDVARKEIDAFNQQFLAAHLKMDNAAILDLWAEDGVSLLPETPPIMGKKAIGKFLSDVTSQLAGYHMEKMELDFQGIEVSGDWASEWTLEHQVVRGPADKPPFEGRGKMLLVLHREAGGQWRVKREMWNAGEKPSAEKR